MDLFLKPSLSAAASSSSSSELLINYGFQSNDRFLLNYGFIEENNPHDIYDFDQNIIELLLELDKNENTDQVNIPAPPSSPSPEERIRFLSTLFYSLAPVDVNASDRNKINDDAQRQQRQQKTSKALIDRSEENKRTVKYHRTKPQQSIGNAETTTARMQNGKSGVKEHFDGITNSILLALYSSPEEWKQLFPSSLSSQGLLDLTTANQYYQKIQQFSFNSESIKRVEDILRIIIKQELSSKPTTLEEMKICYPQ
eukprot:CAMPEP_0173159406 /NCGR_PEP_ID=MMETSP1105-20130129/17107_1 /TAXON_ID=2985 /ORGANISM="Ochromonas sp., Strain BG-1" /LENGTH=254 /DNA_ID=CAMNT_0014077867 /DNA_START=814 /DNA_END=1578 /DNA_ORIENTATION=+